MTVCFVDEVGGRKFVFLGVFLEQYDRFAIKVCKALVVAVGKRAADYLFHYGSGSFLLVLFERVVVAGTVYERDINRYVPLAY